MQLTEQRKWKHFQTSVKIGEVCPEQHIGGKRGHTIPQRITERREQRVDAEHSGAEYDLSPSFHDGFEHSDQVTRSVLMVGIEHDHVAPGSQGGAIQYRCTLTEVCIMTAKKDTRIVNPLEKIRGPIQTAIVHDDQFESVAEFHLKDLGNGLFDRALFIVDRHHN